MFSGGCDFWRRQSGYAASVKLLPAGVRFPTAQVGLLFTREPIRTEVAQACSYHAITPSRHHANFGKGWVDEASMRPMRRPTRINAGSPLSSRNKTFQPSYSVLEPVISNT